MVSNIETERLREAETERPGVQTSCAAGISPVTDVGWLAAAPAVTLGIKLFHERSAVRFFPPRSMALRWRVRLLSSAIHTASSTVRNCSVDVSWAVT
jgi:hypothetical protein